jgi:hypothetical protein
MVRAVFLNSLASNLMASRDGPGDETPSSWSVDREAWTVNCEPSVETSLEAPSSGRACGQFRSARSRWFSGLSRLAQ